MNKNGKRLRDVDYPRITFHAPERTFDRLFKECSLHDLKQTVKMKLGLKSDSIVHLAQLRDGHAVDLEDKDDFDAFYTVAHSQRLVNVQVELAEDPDDSARPEDLPSVVEDETITAAATESKKRKVAFIEPSTEDVERPDVSDEPRRKKRKDDSDSVAAVAVTKPGPSSDSTVAPKKKKKRKVKSKANEPVASPVVEPQSVPASAREDNQSRRSVAGVQVGPAPRASENPEAVESSLDSGLPVKTSAISEKGSISSKDTTSTKTKSRSARHKPDNTKDAMECQAPPRPPVDAGDVVDGLNQEPIHEGDNLVKKKGKDSARSVQDQADASGSKSQTKNGNFSSADEIDAESAPNVETHDSTAVDQGETESTRENIVDSDAEDVDEFLVAKKKVPAGDINPPTASNDTIPSLPVTKDQAHDAKQPERKRTVKSSKTTSVPVCPACNKAPKHDLIDCPIVQGGPISIQKRIKALRVSKKFPDKEKLAVIDELKKIKEDQKIKAKESKVNAQSHSPSSSSRPQDAEANEGSSDRTKGVSKQSHSVNQVSSSRETSYNETTSLGSDVQRKAERKKVDGNKPFVLHGVGDVSDLANLDLDALVRGPKNTMLSVNDLPSSEENDEDAEKMSCATEEDEAERQYPPSKSAGDGSLDDDDSDGEHDNVGEPMDVLDHTENRATVTEDLSRAADVSPSSREQSSPQQSDIPGGKDMDVDSSVAGTDSEEEAPIADLLGDAKGDQSISNSTNDSAVVPGGGLNQRPGRAEELAVSPQRVQSAEHESIRRSPIIENSNEISLLNKGRTKSSGKEENDSPPKGSVTKMLKRGKEVSLSQVSNVIQSNAARTKSSLRATSPTSGTPANNHEPRTPGRRSAKLVGQVKFASNEKGKETTTKLRKKANDKGAKPSDLMAGRSQDHETSPASMPISKLTALTSSSRAEDDSGVMDDELVSNSPLAAKSSTRKKKVNKANGGTLVSPSNQPLFIPSGSQMPFPYSQNTHLEGRVGGAKSDSEEEAGMNNSHTPHKFRRLSEISGQTLFTRPSLKAPQASTSGDKADLYGKQGKRGKDDDEDDDGDDSGSDSGSEDEKISHIPKTRMAGA